jgi:hypothetical protein
MFHVPAQHAVKFPPAQRAVPNWFIEFPGRPLTTEENARANARVFSVVCDRCGSWHLNDRSCGCFDNHGQ